MKYVCTDPHKNQLSSEVIDRLLREGCWINVHLTQPYGPVFEIRVREGYGARWSHDGLKVHVLRFPINVLVVLGSDVIR